MGAITLRMRIESRLRRPVGRLGLAITVLVLATAPAFLFFDPVDFIPRRGHVPREPLGIYTLFSDDVAYVSGSRTWPRTLSNLFVPHNTHIVPAWRVLTWALVTAAGRLERVPDVLAVASYAILVAVMLLTGRVVARESGQTILGLVAMVLVGTTSLMLVPATWYSAGQPLWAGFGMLATLWYAQSYRRSGRMAALALAAASAPLAGWFWTVGHLAGPVAAVYLWVDGRRWCRLAATAPLAASLLAVALSLAIGGRRIDSTISFHGRSVRNAVSPVLGLFHTGQAIPENLVFANLGLTVHTTQAQGALLSLGVILLWSSRWWLYRLRPLRAGTISRQPGPASGTTRSLCPLECAGAALVLGSYAIEWVFRGYMDYQYLRTISLRFVVPWYDAIPQIGAVLLTMGWWAATRPETARLRVITTHKSVTLWGILGVGTLAVLLIALNRPRVDAAVRNSVPSLLRSERESKLFALPRHQTLRANLLLMGRAEWQRRHLRRLDRCEETARRMGLGRDAIRAAFVHPWIPATFIVLSPTQYDLYDAVALLDLPEQGRQVDPPTVRGALAEFLAEDSEPRPFWLGPQ
ncbi:MAG: hypothetical protein ACHRXM_18375, partial [Isosphaerales bacterium]